MYSQFDLTHLVLVHVDVELCEHSVWLSASSKQQAWYTHTHKARMCKRKMRKKGCVCLIVSRKLNLSASRIILIVFNILPFTLFLSPCLRFRFLLPRLRSRSVYTCSRASLFPNLLFIYLYSNFIFEMIEYTSHMADTVWRQFDRSQVRHCLFDANRFLFNAVCRVQCTFYIVHSYSSHTRTVFGTREHMDGDMGGRGVGFRRVLFFLQQIVIILWLLLSFILLDGRMVCTAQFSFIGAIRFWNY